MTSGAFVRNFNVNVKVGWRRGRMGISLSQTYPHGIQSVRRQHGPDLTRSRKIALRRCHQPCAGCRAAHGSFPWCTQSVACESGLFRPARNKAITDSGLVLKEDADERESSCLRLTQQVNGDGPNTMEMCWCYNPRLTHGRNWSIAVNAEGTGEAPTSPTGNGLN
jgi:hypothetical protein